jgi:hypothetical protein
LRQNYKQSLRTIMSESMDESGVRFLSKNLSATVPTPISSTTTTPASCFNFNNTHMNMRVTSHSSSLLSTTSSSSSASSSTAAPLSANDETFGGGENIDMIINFDPHKISLVENNGNKFASKQPDSYLTNISIFISSKFSKFNKQRL